MYGVVPACLASLDLGPHRSRRIGGMEREDGRKEFWPSKSPKPYLKCMEVIV